MASTSLPAATQKLYDVIVAALPAVKVSWGNLPPGDTAEESIQVGVKQTSDRDWTTMRTPPHPLHESIEIDTVVEVVRGDGQNREPTYDRAFVIVEAIENALRANDTLDGVCMWAKLTRVRQEFFVVDRKPGARVFLTLTGETRI